MPRNINGEVAPRSYYSPSLYCPGGVQWGNSKNVLLQLHQPFPARLPSWCTSNRFVLFSRIREIRLGERLIGEEHIAG